MILYMLIRQSKNTFIRFIGEKGYITNQMTRHDRNYNETGADFLREISRIPQDVEDIIRRLKTLYGDSVSYEELKADFFEFIEDLDKHLFLVSGNTIEELNAKDVDFSYSMGKEQNNTLEKARKIICLRQVRESLV